MYIPKLSVVIPIYNAQKYIGQCLDSIINQPFKDIEIICINDGSTDNTLSILKEYASKDSRIIIINQTNQGAGSARNKGIESAKGEYIHFMDADDYLADNAYEELYKKAQENDLDIIKCKAYAIDEQTQKPIIDFYYELNKIDKNFCNKIINFYEAPEILVKMPVTPWLGLHKTDFLKANNISFNNLICVNDRSFSVEALINAKKMMLVDFYILNHRRNISSSLVSIRDKYFDCHYSSYKIINDKIKRLPKKIKNIILREEMYDISVWYCAFRDRQSIYINEIEKSLSVFLKHIDRKLVPSDILFLKPRRLTSKLLEALFSLKNENIHKVIGILGIKIKIKSQKLILKKQGVFIDQQQAMLEELSRRMEDTRLYMMDRQEKRINETETDIFFLKGNTKNLELSILYASQQYIKYSLTNNIKISVIVPIYNREKFLQNCLNSICNQTFKDIEIICVNDCSTDNSLLILNEYALKDSRIVILNTSQQGGPSRARNKALSIAKGKYISFVDSDDFIVPSLYDDIYPIMESVDCDIACFNAGVFGDDTMYSSIDYLKNHYDGLLKLNDEIISNINVFLWSKLFRRDFIERFNLRFIEGRYYGDFVFTRSYLLLAKTVYFHEITGYYYRMHNDSIMGKTALKTIKHSMHHLYAWKDLYDFAVSRNILNIHENLFTKMFEEYVRNAGRYIHSNDVEDMIKVSREYAKIIQYDNIDDLLKNID
ncbi:MAG: glycosyltransferase [Elusimicrobiota bacterium]|jgi:glycosyltransferase involved in cell wall biosynthesis|nr:glycosyltransferase [Elusimicrobiota bacterium]